MDPYKAIIDEYRKTKDDFLANDDIFDEDPDRLRRVKDIITHRLDQVDRAILILYADCQSYRKLGKILGVSHVTAGKKVRRVRALVLEEYNKQTK